MTVACNAMAAAPQARDPWTDYQIIMWQKPTPKQAPALKQLGVTAGVFGANRDDNGPFIDRQIETFLAADLRWYVENIATDFYAPYHKWTPGHAVNWRFVEAQELYRKNPSDRRAFIRDPSLSDPQFLSKIRDRIARTVRAHAQYSPLYYSLGDETGIGDLAAFWDFDLSDESLRGMRDWLKAQYGTLAALNRQWGSHYAAWDDIMPMTTDEAMKRTDGNYSAWADFKAWMDVAYAHALRAGTDAVHRADPKALAGIEGGQIPGWGGYDYTQLANAVDVMELYDFGDNVEIVRSLNPKMIILTTSFDGGPAETHRVWHELLQGNRGLILWDEKSEFIGEDGSLGPRGREAAPTYRKIRDGLGALLIGSARHTDPVAILYSPASMRTSWMLDWKDKGDAWSRRDAEAEYEDTPLRSATANYLRRVEHAGLQPMFVAPQQVETGKLQQAGFRILMLPHAIALSAKEADAIRRFVRQGGMVIADIEPGTYDQHSRRLPKSPLSDLFTNQLSGRPKDTPYIWRLMPSPSPESSKTPVSRPRCRSQRRTARPRPTSAPIYSGTAMRPWSPCNAIWLTVRRAKAPKRLK